MALSRRTWLSLAAALAGGAASGWFPLLADAPPAEKQRRRRCILLWMTGGPSQLDTFDLKPGHEHGGPLKSIPTNVPGIHISEHLPRLAGMADKLAILRGMSTAEADHGRGTYLIRTGQRPMGPVQYPSLGATLAHQLGQEGDVLPNFVSVAPYSIFNPQAFGPGFLGPRYSPLTIGAIRPGQPIQPTPAAEGYAELKIDDLEAATGLDADRRKRRRRFWNQLQDRFAADRSVEAVQAQRTVYERAFELLNSQAAEAFDLSQEQDAVRQRYGRGRFGQGCLLARRLIERGVSFVEVSLGAFGGGALGWDTHRNNFQLVQQLSAELDAGWATLMRELDERGLLEDTTILWAGEFGRTPKINQGQGRDHFAQAWTTVLAGGGVAGGQTFGSTSADGMEVRDGKLSAGDLLATLCRACGLDPRKTQTSSQGRPIALAEGEPAKEVLS